MKEDLYINLIYKKLSGEISDQETRNLDGWLEQAKENRETLDAITTAWDATGNLKPSITLDLDQEFTALDRRITDNENLDEAPAKVKALRPTERKSSISTLWRIAAGLVFLIAGYFISQNVLGSKSQMVEVQSTDIIKQLTLPDGSQITLNKNSSLSYDQNLLGAQRIVHLTGEAYFDVSHDPKKPFIVNFAGQQVEVLGTSFNISSNESSARVALISGKIKWVNISKNKTIELTPGMSVHQNQLTGEISTSKDAGYNFDYWRDQQINFEETPLKNVLSDLERIYDIQISDLPLNISDCRFTSSFEKASLKTILETLSTVFGIEVIQINSKTYQLKGGECQ